LAEGAVEAGAGGIGTGLLVFPVGRELVMVIPLLGAGLILMLQHQLLRLKQSY
jgi:hypothetical protein